MTIYDPTNYQRRIPLEYGCYLLQAVATQGGDYDMFLPDNQYIGSRATEAVARSYVTSFYPRLKNVDICRNNVDIAKVTGNVST